MDDATSTPISSGSRQTSTTCSTPRPRRAAPRPTARSGRTGSCCFTCCSALSSSAPCCPLVKGFGRLPAAVSRAFAAALNAGTRPFHVVNYLCALPGGRVLGSRAMGRLMDSTIGHLRASLGRESERTLGTRHALPDRLGSLLQRRHDHRRRLPLPDPALRPSPPPAHHAPRSTSEPLPLTQPVGARRLRL